MQPGNAGIIQADVDALAAANGCHYVAQRKDFAAFLDAKERCVHRRPSLSIEAVSKVLPLGYPSCHGTYREITCRYVVHRDSGSTWHR